MSKPDFAKGDSLVVVPVNHTVVTLVSFAVVWKQRYCQKLQPQWVITCAGPKPG